MTLGEYIQTLRKEKGYSQEALGEALGVTRQSISKWESDGAIPEVEKLIAMSRLFGVPVGVLLQVEEPAGEELPHELTERELQAVEAIVAKYLAESRRLQAPSKKKKWFKAVVVLLCAAVAAGGLSSWNQNIQDRIDNLHYNNSNMENRITHQINSISGQVEEILDRQNAVTADESYTIESADLKNGTVNFSLSATPRDYVDGMTAVFSAQPAEGVVASVEGTMDPATKTFSAELTCPVSNTITLSVAFRNGDEVQTRILDTQKGLENQTRPYLSCHSFILMDNIAAGVDYHWTHSISFFFREEEFKTANELLTIAAEQVRFRVYLNREEVFRSGVTDLTIPTEDGNDRRDIPMDLTLPLTEGDEILVVAEVTDSHGRTYFEVGEAFVVEEWEISYGDRPSDLNWIEP